MQRQATLLKSAVEEKVAGGHEHKEYDLKGFQLKHLENLFKDCQVAEKKRK